MNRFCIETRGIESWRERLANPETQWVRGFSAFEAAVAWESAASTEAGLPAPIAKLLATAGYANPRLLLGIAEHHVKLDGQGHDSQCDLWGLIAASIGQISLSVEAKANEPFGDQNQSLKDWLVDGKSDGSKLNRAKRWDHVRRNLPQLQSAGYDEVAFQLLHRCASSVIEAARFSLHHAVFLVQAFQCPTCSYDEFAKLCSAIGTPATKNVLHSTTVGAISLSIGWVDLPLATDAQIVKLISNRQ